MDLPLVCSNPSCGKQVSKAQAFTVMKYTACSLPCLRVVKDTFIKPIQEAEEEARRKKAKANTHTSSCGGSGPACC